MTVETGERDVRGTILAAEVAFIEGDMDCAERALLAALSEVRKAKSVRGGLDEQ